MKGQGRTKTTGVSGAALARELGCSPASLTNQKKTGVIKALPDGTFDREKTLRDIAKRTSGAAGGWETGLRHGKPSLRERAEKLLSAGKPGRKVPTVKTPDETPLPPNFGYGIAYFARQLRDEGRIDTMAQLAHEAIDIREADGRNLAKIFVHLVNGWVVDFIGEIVGPEYGQKFEADLLAWVGANIAYQKDQAI